MESGDVLNAASELESCHLENEDEEDIFISRCSEADTKFDTIVGHLEDIIMGDEFQTIQTEFLDAHYQEFDESEENKFVYSDIHHSYTQLIETFLANELSIRSPGFNMNEFQNELMLRKDEIESEIFEILLTFTDFLIFKDLILDYKASKDGCGSVDLSTAMKVTHLNLSGSSSPSGACSPTGGSNPSNGAGDEIRRSIPPSTPTQLADLDFCVVGTAVLPKRDSSE